MNQYAISLYDDNGDYTFSCDNKEFLKEFATYIQKFFTEFNGKVTVSNTK